MQYAIRFFLGMLACVASSVAPIAAQDIVTSLGGHWRLTETGGLTAVDASTVGNDGTYMNGVTLANSTPVPVDGAIAARFDGVNDYVAIPNESQYDGTGPLTIAVWVKINAFTAVDQSIVSKGENASARLHRDGSTDGIAFVCQGLTVTRVNSITSVNDGKWHHIVGVYTGSQLRIYIDGALNNSVNSTGSVSTNNFPITIGKAVEFGGREFNGWIYDVRLYGRGLTAGDVSYLYLSGGPVGHWKLAETSGTTAADSSLYAANGTVSGGASWSAACSGVPTFDFDGVNHYVSVPNAPQLQPTTALTIAAWIRGNSWSSADVVNAIVRKGDNNPNNYELAIVDGRVGLFLDDSDSAGIRGNTALATGQWYHVAATWDGSNVRIYVNGQLDNTPTARTGTIGTDTRPLYVGGRPITDQFHGMMRDVRLYNRALSAVEIARIFGLIGHWRFAEGSGTAAADSSGLANNATLYSGASWTTDCAGNHNALLTNGAGAYARTNANFDPPEVGTVAFWMRSNGNPPTLGRIFGVGGDWEARQLPNGVVVFDLCGEGGGHFETTVPLGVAGRWYHLAATFDSADDSYAIYIDGQLHKAGTNSNAMIQRPAAILSFGRRTGSTEYWQGAMRDFRVYSRRLCPGEIAELYGLIGHWELDAASGTLVADSSGLGRDGSVIGTANWKPGAVDRCLQLNGATRAEVSSLMGAPRNVTLAGWAYLTAPDTNGSELISIGDYIAIRLDQSGGTTNAVLFNGVAWEAVSVNQTFDGTGWHHFAAAFSDDRNYFKLYIDGVEAATLTTTATISYTGLGSKTVIGAHGNGVTTRDFSGRVDDLRVYNRALCPAEIQILHQLGSGAFDGVRIIKWIEIQ